MGKVISNYPLPTIDSILAHFNGCKFFSTIGLRYGYYHILLTKEVAEKTAFLTEKDKWILHSLPFGINIGPSAFSYVLDKVLALCTEFACNYLDDIMIFSKTWQDHLNHLEEVFKCLQDADLKIKCSKCEFFKSQVHYLGFFVGTQGVQPLPEKVTAIEALEPPKDIDELRQFLGLVGFYRKFTPFFIDVMVCLNTMLGKVAVFKCTEQCGNTFRFLKSELVKMPKLQYSNPNKPFMLFTGASQHSYSGILHQDKTSHHLGAEVSLIPIAYFSGSFRRTQQLWNTTQKECYAVYRSIQKFAFYLAGMKCTLSCDHKPLAPFFTTGMSSPVLDRWGLKLQQFDIKFWHIQGKRNVVADGISRLRTLGLYQDNNNEDIPSSIEDVVENIIEEVHSADTATKKSTYNVGKHNLEVLRKEQQWDWFCKSKVRDIKKKPNHNFLLDHYSILRKVTKLKYKIEPAVIVPIKLTFLMIIDFHNAKGHKGISRMVNMFRCYFWWVGMWTDVHQHINTCKLCIQLLPGRVYSQPLHLEMPQVPFAGCTMDCIGLLSTTSKGHKHALTLSVY